MSGDHDDSVSFAPSSAPDTCTPVTASAPGRVNLIGEHLDYLGGRCLSIALEQRTTASVHLRTDQRLVFRSGSRTWHGSVDQLTGGSVRGWARYVAGVLWALDVRHGMEIQIESTLPMAAGLSSSAALACSVVVAVNHALDLRLDPVALARAAYRAETEMVGAPTGQLDQFVSILAEPHEALLVDFTGHVPTWERLPFHPARQRLTFLVVNTGVLHDMTSGGYGQRRSECEAAARQLGLDRLGDARDLPVTAIASLPEVLARRTRFVVSELERVSAMVSCLRDGAWENLGALLDQGHVGARDDFEISCPEVDQAVEDARAAGAWGARMTGGGFGGCALALVPDEKVPTVEAAVARGFAARGWSAPGFLLARAGPGAGLH